MQGIVNPVTTREWTFSLRLEKFGKTYATAPDITIPIYEPSTVRQIDNIEVLMNIANTGEESTY